MFSFVKKYWFFIVLATIATILGILWANKPAEQPTEETTRKPVPLLQKTGLPGKNIDPKTQIVNTDEPQNTSLPVLSLTRKQPFSPQEAKIIATALGFTIEPFVSQDIQEGQVYSWTEGDNFMSIGARSQKVSFGKDLLLSPPPTTGQFPSLDAAKVQVFSLLKSAGLSGEETKTTSRYISLSGSVPVETTLENAVFLEISMSSEFEGLNLVSSDPEMVLARAWFDKQGNITRFDWKNPIESLAKTEEYDLKDKTEIDKSLLQEGRIIKIGDGSFENPNPEDLLSIKTTSIKSAYFVPDEGALIEPIFILQGESLSSSGQSYPVWIYLSATKEAYFKQSP